jgi:hypothetical protein
MATATSVRGLAFVAYLQRPLVMASSAIQAKAKDSATHEASPPCAIMTTAPFGVTYCLSCRRKKSNVVHKNDTSPHQCSQNGHRCATGGHGLNESKGGPSVARLGPLNEGSP